MTKQDVEKWIDAHSTKVNFDEAEALIFKNQPVPSFRMKKGDKVAFPRTMMYRDRIGKEPYEASTTLFKTPIEKCKMNLPLFSFHKDDYVSACVLDIESGVSRYAMRRALKDFSYLMYFSASSTLESPRLHVIIPLTEPVKTLHYEYMKDKLMECFDNVPDVHSFESSRFFFMPSKYCGQYREENKITCNIGASFDFYATFDINLLDELRMKEEMKKKESNGDYRNVYDDERVQYYLTTDFPLMQGNGDSASSFYTALCVCIAHEDEDTLEEVIDKARSENWSEKEIDYNIKKAKQFCGK